MTKIIIVEDDPMISEIYRKKFSDSGFEVMAADTGEQVLDIAREEKPDAILLDLIMPKMDGFEVIKKIRGGEYDPAIKIIVSSNLSSSDNVKKALEAGANGFVAKSDFTPSELVKEVRRLLDQYAERQKNEADKSGAVEKQKAKDGKKILMIEDEEIFIELFGNKLKQDGYDVSFAKNGAWGVREALKGGFDLFVIDMVMPAMTGDEIVEKIKMEEETKNIPIIILSASAEDEAIKKVKEMGVNAFFVKTQVVPSELSKQVSILLKK